MTEQEFRDWSRRLFVSFPSLWEWLKRSSPDVTGTLTLWRKQLSGYCVDECAEVLERWEIDGPGFEGYEKDKVALCVKATIDRTRGVLESRRANAEEARRRNDKREQRTGATRVQFALHGDARKVVEHLVPYYKRFQSGEITCKEYEDYKDAYIYKEMGIASSLPYGET